MTIHKTLEILNGAWSILSLCLLVFLVVYFIGQWRAENLNWKSWASLPLGMAVALSMFVQNAGGFGSRLTVWSWRHFRPGEALSTTDLYLLIIFAAIANVGALMVIRIFSRPRFGDGPWLASFLIAVIYILFAVSSGS